MSTIDPQPVAPSGASVVAVYPDHPTAERAVRRLHKEGFAMKDLSIVGRDFQVTEEPVGFVSAGDYAAAGAGTGAWVGGLFGLLLGAAFMILPGPAKITASMSSRSRPPRLARPVKNGASWPSTRWVTLAQRTWNSPAIPSPIRE